MVDDVQDRSGRICAWLSVSSDGLGTGVVAVGCAVVVAVVVGGVVLVGDGPSFGVVT